MGVERTFEVLATAPVELAVEAYLAALEEEHPALVGLASERLLEGKVPAHARRVFERFQALPEPVQERLLAEPTRWQKWLQPLLADPAEERRATAVRFAARAMDPSAAPVAAALLVAGESARRRAGEYFRAFADALAQPRRANDPVLPWREGLSGRTLLQGLIAALGNFDRHGESAVLQCLLELDGEAHETLLGVLAMPTPKRQAALCALLQEQRSLGVASFLVRLGRMKDPTLLAVARDACAAQSGKGLGAFLLNYLWGLRDSEREALAMRTGDLPWWPCVAEELPNLRAEESERLFEFLAATTAPMAPLAAALGDLFDSAPPALRVRIVRHAARAHAPEMSPVLTLALREENEVIQSTALDGLLELNSPDLARQLAPALSSPYREVRHRASRLLSQRSFARYLSRFDALDPETRDRAGKALAKIDEGMVDRLSDELQSLDAARRLKALQVLEIVGRERDMATNLYDLFRDPDRKVRATVMKAIGLLGTVDSIKLLLQALSDPDRRIRANAIEAFQDIRNPKFAEILLPFLRDPDNRSRGNAAKALWILGRREDVERALVEMLAHRDDLMRLSALWVLAEIEHPNAARLIGPLGDSDPSERVRIKAKELLRKA